MKTSSPSPARAAHSARLWVQDSIAGLILIGLSLCFLTACGTPTPANPGCDPNQFPELRSVTVENSGQENLQDYPIALRLDQANFDFSIPAPDGSDLAVWDADTHQPVPDWVESYDPTAGQALLWVKAPALLPQSQQKLLLTAGLAAGCTASGSSGYAVFPFFSDVADVSNWRASNQLSVTNTVVQGPLTVVHRSVIESDSMYNGFPGLAQAANGDFVLSYKKGVDHVNSPLVILRRSSDGGATWTPEVVLDDTSIPDPGLMQTPLGDLVITFGKLDPNGNGGAAYARSTDNGVTWGSLTFFDNPVADTPVMDPLLNVGSIMYGAGYGPYSGGSGDTPTLWSSADDGLTWTKISQLRLTGDPGLNETAIALTAPNTLFAMMRTNDSLDTFGRYSSDMGSSWGSLISYTAQVGVLQAPQLIQAGSALILMGRQNVGIPGVAPPNTIGYPRQLVAYVSYDGGQTFSDGLVLDTYTGQQIDGGYCWPILLANGQLYVVYYADSHNLREPDIKSVTLSVAPPVSVPVNAIHVLSQLAPGLASQPLTINATRYSLEFRFRSAPTPAGSQLSVVLQGQSSGALSNLVNWELPSTHAADPTADSGFISNGQFVQLLNTFSYGQTYRLRTVIDETQATQQPFLLDEFGSVIASADPLPLAQGTSHAAVLQIGNNSALRATDTLLDFIFLHSAAQTEPTVTITAVK